MRKRYVSSLLSTILLFSSAGAWAEKAVYDYMINNFSPYLLYCVVKFLPIGLSYYTNITIAAGGSYSYGARYVWYTTGFQQLTAKDQPTIAGVWCRPCASCHTNINQCLTPTNDNLLLGGGVLGSGTGCSTALSENVTVGMRIDYSSGTNFSVSKYCAWN